MPKFPDVKVKLVGEDGNVFNLAGIVYKALTRAGHHNEADQMFTDLEKCKSYDEALQLFMATVEVE